jgi:hypothetical protein
MHIHKRLSKAQRLKRVALPVHKKHMQLTGFDGTRAWHFFNSCLHAQQTFYHQYLSMTPRGISSITINFGGRTRHSITTLLTTSNNQRSPEIIFAMLALMFRC